VQAAWLYAQMVRWRQTPFSAAALKTATAVFRPDLYEAALGGSDSARVEASGAVGAFAGPAFDPDNIAGYLAGFDIPQRA
jgi:NitT/TauT family transport system ATP-binding protein